MAWRSFFEHLAFPVGGHENGLLRTLRPRHLAQHVPAPQNDDAVAQPHQLGQVGGNQQHALAGVGHVGNGGRVLLERCMADTGVEIDAAYARWKTHYREHLTVETTLYPGVADGLRALAAAGHTLAVATNKPQAASDLIIRFFGLEPLLYAVLGGGGPCALKPDPAMIETLMTQTGIAADRTWMIGDNYTDLECARRAGVRSLFLTYGYGETRGETPTLTLNSFADVTAKFV